MEKHLLQFERKKDAAVQMSVEFKIENMFECVDRRMHVRYTLFYRTNICLLLKKCIVCREQERGTDEYRCS